MRVCAFEHAQLVQQRDERAIPLLRRRHVVGAPRVRHNSVLFARARRPPRRRFEFEQHEVLEARAQKPPRRREPGHAAPDDDDSRTLPRLRLRPQPVADEMTQTV